jgi:hypothetical protein
MFSANGFLKAENEQAEKRTNLLPRLGTVALWQMGRFLEGAQG